MKSIIYLTLIFVVALSDFAFAQDAAYTAAISKDPNAETPRYDYAYYLYSLKRFKEARTQLKQLFELNIKHKEGRKLLSHIDEIDGLDVAYQDQQMRLFMLEKMKRDEKKKAAGDSHDLTPQRIAEIHKDLDKRYQISQRIGSESHLESGESVFQENFANSKQKGEFDKAERIAKSWIAQFDKSAVAKADFCAFLILRDRIPQAEILIKSGLKTNPDSVKLRIVSDGLNEIKTVKSSEKTQELKEKLSNELAVYQLTMDGQLPHQTSNTR